MRLVGLLSVRLAAVLTDGFVDRVDIEGIGGTDASATFVAALQLRDDSFFFFLSHFFLQVVKRFCYENSKKYNNTYLIICQNIKIDFEYY